MMHMKTGTLTLLLLVTISCLALLPGSAGCGGGGETGSMGSSGGGGYSSGASGSSISISAPSISSCVNLTDSDQAFRSGDWLQVNGSGFGASTSSSAGSVVFTDGTASAAAALYYSWSDTVIVCRIPDGIPLTSVSVKVITSSGESSAGMIILVNATPNPSPQATPPSVTPTPTPTPTSTPTPTPTPTSSPSPSSGTMNIQTTLSDNGQKYTIAFDGLAFLTGTLGADSFLPPGKVADYAGFQYFRDNDPTGMGHNTDFVTIVASNILNIMTSDQINTFVTTAKSQVTSVNNYAYKRFYLMKGFRRLLEGDVPSGTTGLSKSAIQAYSAELYKIDGQISIARAQLYGNMMKSMTTKQKAKIDALKGKNGVGNWDTNLSDPLKSLNLDPDVNVQVMTYASEMYSWYAGSIEADVYFCPERQATYFGSFYMKDGAAMGNPNYSIGTNITGDYGESFLNALTTEQASLVTSLVDTQRTDLNNIVTTRQAIATELRRFLTETSPDTDAITAKVLDLSVTYGQEDGAICYYYATNFAAVSKTTTDSQKTQLQALRTKLLGTLAPTGAYLYSSPISMPAIDNTDSLFGN